jgi:pSer/pThr/pTyr-binding forkhead associated (FHA) protein
MTTAPGPVPWIPGRVAGASERPPGVWIVYRTGGRTRATFEVTAAVADIGRAPGLAVVVRAGGVSRQHARITWDGAAYWVEDLQSRYGTYVNGLAVPRHGKERLRHLDVVRLGRRVQLIVLVPAAPVRVVKRRCVVRATLQPLVGDTAPHELTAGAATLGRDAINQVVVGAPAVSRTHARIHRTAEHVTVQDLGSANGTLVNGARVVAALLEDGDRLCLGGVVKYRVEIETADVWCVPEEPPPPPPTAPEALLEPGPEGTPAPERITRIRLAGRGLELSVGTPGTYVVGRSKEAHLRLDDPTVSRVQARLTLAADRISARLEHVGHSASLLNGRELSGTRDLTDGDVLQLGDVRLLVSLESAEGTPPGTSPSI